MKTLKKLDIQAQNLVQEFNRWYTIMVIGVPCGLLMFFIELAQRRVHLYMFHLVCAVIYYVCLKAQPASKTYALLSTLSYIAFSVQSKLVFTSLLPSDAA